VAGDGGEDDREWDAEAADTIRLQLTIRELYL
jgi:hypothetical protein